MEIQSSSPSTEQFTIKQKSDIINKSHFSQLKLKKCTKCKKKKLETTEFFYFDKRRESFDSRCRCCRRKERNKQNKKKRQLLKRKEREFQGFDSKIIGVINDEIIDSVAPLLVECIQELIDEGQIK